MKNFLTRPPWKWMLPAAAGLLALYTVFGFFIAPALVANQAPEALEERYNCQVELGEVNINPFVLSIEARDFRIGFPDKTPFAGFHRLYLNFQLSSLFRWALTFKQVSLDKPYLGLVLMENGNLNLSRLSRADNATQDAGRTEDANGDPLRLLLHHIEVSNGTLEFDNLRQSPPAAIAFDPIDLELANLSTLPDREGPYTLQATTGREESLTWTGVLLLTPFSSNGTLSFENIRTETLQEFLLSSLNTAPPQGTLDLETEYVLDTKGADVTFQCRDISAALNNLALSLPQAGQPFLELGRVMLDNGSFDLAARRLDIPALGFANATLDVLLSRDGTLNLSRAWQPATRPGEDQAGPDETAEAAPWEIVFEEVTLDHLGLKVEDQSRTLPLQVRLADSSASFAASLRTGSQLQALVSSARVDLQGIEAGPLGSRPELTISSLGLDGGNFDLAKRSLTAGQLLVTDGSLQVLRSSEGINWAALLTAANATRTEEPSSEGTEAAEKWQASLERAGVSGFSIDYADRTVQADAPILSLADLSAEALQVTTTDTFPLSMSFTVEQGGSFSANGTVDPDSGQVQAGVSLKDLSLLPAQPYIDSVALVDLRSGTLTLDAGLNAGGEGEGFPLELDAELGVDDLNIVEREANATLLGWKRLHTDSFRLALQPHGLTIGEVQLTEPRGRLIIDEEKRVNVVEVFKTREGNATAPAEPPPTEPSGADPFPVSVGSLRISDGTLDFTDRSLVLPFSSTIHDLKGMVSEITSTSGAEASIDLDGQVDQYGVSTIKGSMDFFDPKRFTDVTVVFENVSMTTLNPYTATFAGRKIASGKLYLDLEYNILNATLQGENEIVVEELTLGEEVQSEQAVNLPLKLAVALLKDSSGTIDIGLPVKGDLNDPEFGFGHLIGRAIFNLLTKIVTSPFRILGALLPDLGSDDIDSVSFEPGRSDLPPPEQEKAVQLAQALAERPELALTVQGRWEPEADARALRDLMLRRQMAGKVGRQLEAGEDPGPVNLESRTVLDTLKALYGERFGFGTMNELVRSLTAEADQNATEFAEGRGNERLARELFERLREAQELSEGALEALGLQRARTVAHVLTEQGGLDQERITMRPPEVLGEDGTPEVSFSLDTVD